MLSGCGTDSNQSGSNENPTSIIIRNKSKLELPKGVEKVKLGDTLNIEVSANDVTIDSVEIGYQSRKLLTSKNSKIQIASLSLNATGTPRIIAKVYLSNGKSESLYPKFTILPAAPKKITYQKTAEFPHDRTSYTQGLFFREGVLYESTGQNGTSRVMTVDKKTGKSIKSINLDDAFFGEGITFIDDRIYQVTYEEQQAFVYDLDFNKLHTFNYSGEGWGLTKIGDTLLMSNGSENIYFRNKDSFEVIKTLAVHDHNGPVGKLNELELINDYLYANIYLTNVIVKIDLKNGAVVGQIDLSNIFPERVNYGSTVDVLNGIAYLPSEDKVYITGKLWPKLYEIKLVQ